jgi:hypothetical protein
MGTMMGERMSRQAVKQPVRRHPGNFWSDLVVRSGSMIENNATLFFVF